MSKVLKILIDTVVVHY